MSTLINLGTFSSANGKTTGLGLASGLDGSSLIDSILQARTDAVTAVEDTIATNVEKIAAVSELSTLLARLQTTADFLRSAPGVGNDDSDFFQYTTTSLTSSSSTEASTYLSVVSEAGATINSYEIEDIVVANEHILRYDGITSDSDSVVGDSLDFSAGTFTLRGVDVTLEEGDSLLQIKANINAVTTTSGVRAEIVQVDDDSFSLVLKSTVTGEDNDITEYDTADDSLLFGGADVTFTEQQVANDASFTIDGLEISRSTNSIDDVLGDITFSLLADTDGETLTLDITHDSDLIKTGVSDFIDAYNALKLFISQQTERDENNELVETALLGDDTILSQVITTIDASLNGIIDGLTDGDPQSLFAVGIGTTTYPGDDTYPETEGIFVIDEAKFDAALAADFDAFRRVFGNNFSADSADIGLYASSRKATLTSFILNIDTSLDEGYQVEILDASTGESLGYADISGNLITGREDTDLEGLKLIYTGDGVDVITITNTQGALSQLYDIISGYLTEDTGIIDVTIDSIAEDDIRLQDEIDKENIQIEVERALLIEKFSQLETIISSANSVLSFLEAQASASSSS